MYVFVDLDSLLSKTAWFLQRKLLKKWSLTFVMRMKTILVEIYAFSHNVVSPKPKSLYKEKRPETDSIKWKKRGITTIYLCFYFTVMTVQKGYKHDKSPWYWYHTFKWYCCSRFSVYCVAFKVFTTLFRGE